jgi:hypothetical protein
MAEGDRPLHNLESPRKPLDPRPDARGRSLHRSWPSAAADRPPPTELAAALPAVFVTASAVASDLRPPATPSGALCQDDFRGGDADESSLPSALDGSRTEIADGVAGSSAATADRRQMHAGAGRCGGETTDAAAAAAAALVEELQRQCERWVCARLSARAVARELFFCVRTGVQFEWVLSCLFAYSGFWAQAIRFVCWFVWFQVAARAAREPGGGRPAARGPPGG